MKWLFRIISRYKYNAYKRKLDSIRELSLSEKEGIKLSNKLNKFVDGLSPAEAVYLGTLYDKFWLELAFMEATKYIEVKKLFERKQIEALQRYLIAGLSEEEVNKMYALTEDETIDKLVAKFRKYCGSVLKVVDKNVK